MGFDCRARGPESATSAEAVKPSGEADRDDDRLGDVTQQAWLVQINTPDHGLPDARRQRKTLEHPRRR